LIFTHSFYVISCVNRLNIYIVTYTIGLYHYYPNTTGMTHREMERKIHGIFRCIRDTACDT